MNLCIILEVFFTDVVILAMNLLQTALYRCLLSAISCYQSIGYAESLLVDEKWRHLHVYRYSITLSNQKIVRYSRVNLSIKLQMQKGENRVFISKSLQSLIFGDVHKCFRLQSDGFVKAVIFKLRLLPDFAWATTLSPSPLMCVFSIFGQKLDDMRQRGRVVRVPL